MDKRATAFARLFQGVQVGAYIGVISADATSTVAANPHLKLIFGYSAETAYEQIGTVRGWIGWQIANEDLLP